MITRKDFSDYLYRVRRNSMCKDTIETVDEINLSKIKFLLIRAVVFLKYILDNYDMQYEFYIAKLALEMKIHRNRIYNLMFFCKENKLIELEHMKTYSVYKITILKKDLIEELFEITKDNSLEYYSMKMLMRERLLLELK